MTKKKRSLLVVTAITMVLILAIGATLAYLTDQRKAANVIRIGAGEDGSQSIGIHLHEPNFIDQILARRADRLAAGSTDLDNDAGKFTAVVPGATPADPVIAVNATDIEAGTHAVGDITDVEKANLVNLLPNFGIHKDPTVTNHGKYDAYIRFRIEHADGSIWTDTELLELTDALGLEIDTTKFTESSTHNYYYTTAGTAEKLVPGNSVSLFKPVDATVFPGGTAPAGVDAAKTTMFIPAWWDYNEINQVKDLLADFIVVAEALQADGHDGEFTNDWEGVQSDNTTGPIVPKPAGQ